MTEFAIVFLALGCGSGAEGFEEQPEVELGVEGDKGVGRVVNLEIVQPEVAVYILDVLRHCVEEKEGRRRRGRRRRRTDGGLRTTPYVEIEPVDGNIED